MTRHGQSDTAKKIVDYIKAWKFTTIGQLCEHFGLAPSTIHLYGPILHYYDPFIRCDGDTFTYEAPEQPNINKKISGNESTGKTQEVNRFD